MSPTAPRTLRDTLTVFGQHTSPRLLLAASAVAVLARVAVGALTGWDLVVAAAIFAWWPIQEWLIHVLLLHFVPRTIAGRRIDPHNARKHRAHHREPNDLALVFIPLRSILTTLPLVVLGALLLFPTTPLALTAIASFVLLSLHYEWCHTLAHVPYAPKIAYYQRICRSHMLHHHRNERAWYGVSRTLADTLFGTDPDGASTPPSPTVKTLGIEG